MDFFLALVDTNANPKVGFHGGVNDEINLVEISTLLHKGLHNALYIQGIALIFDPITYFDPEVGEPFNNVVGPCESRYTRDRPHALAFTIITAWKNSYPTLPFCGV